MTMSRHCVQAKPRLPFLSLALFLAPNLALAEQSGWFFGVQAGYGKGEIETELDGTRQRYIDVQRTHYEFSDIQKQQKKGPLNLGFTNRNQTLEVVGHYDWDPHDKNTYTTTNAYVLGQIENSLNATSTNGYLNNTYRVYQAKR